MNEIDFPTEEQLIKLSKIFNVPSDKLLDTYLFYKQIQDHTKEILSNWGIIQFPICGKYKDNYNLEEVVNEIMNLLEINLKQEKLHLDVLSSNAEFNGIIVTRSEFIENPDRKLDVNEFSGMVLYDDIAPLIFINDNDTTYVKIFTLLVGIAHILVGESASFTIRNFKYPTNKIGKFCYEATLEIMTSFKKVEELLFPCDHEKIKDRLSRNFLGIMEVAEHEGLIQYNDILRITGLDRRTYEEIIKEMND